MSLNNNIQAIFFDFGDTLVSLKPSKEDLFIEAAFEIGLRLDKSTVKRAYECVDFFMKYSSISINEDSRRGDFYKVYNERLCESLGISGSFTRLWPVVAGIFDRKAQWQLIDGVMETLSNLRDLGVRLAVVANWDKNLGDLMQKLGIRDFFDCVVASQEVMAEKPDPAIFLIAVEAMSLSECSDCIVFVGNEYVADIVGARSAGLIACLLDIDNRYPYADCPRIASIGEIFSTIKNICA